MEHKNGVKLSFSSFRQRKGLTQTELGQCVGVGAASVSQWESGKNYPSFDTIKKLFDLGATIEDIFGLEIAEKVQLFIVPHKDENEEEFENKVEKALISIAIKKFGVKMNGL